MKDQVIQVRVSEKEKESYLLAAQVAGIPLASWIRDRLRQSTIKELSNAGLRAPFLIETSPIEEK